MLNLINLDGLEAFKRVKNLIPDWKYGWIIFSLMWRISQLFLKLHSHNSVLKCICSISVLSEFSYIHFRIFIGCRAQNKIREITENLYFTGFFLKLYQICFHVSLSLFLLPEFVIPLFNCYFRDFRGLCDFRVFDLAKQNFNI